MRREAGLLRDAVASIVDSKEESDVDSFFSGRHDGLLGERHRGARRLRARVLPGGEAQMLGLPSTTEVGRRIPKEAFYGRLKLSAALRQSFIDEVERFVIANSIKTSTTGIPDGERVHEVLVVEVALKARRVPEEVLRLWLGRPP